MRQYIFIGNLNYETSAESLKKHLEIISSVKNCEIFIDKFTFKSKGFGKAEVDSLEAALTIIEKLNGEVLEERPLKIELYK